MIPTTRRLTTATGRCSCHVTLQWAVYPDRRLCLHFCSLALLTFIFRHAGDNSPIVFEPALCRRRITYILNTGDCRSPLSSDDRVTSYRICCVPGCSTCCCRFIPFSCHYSVPGKMQLRVAICHTIRHNTYRPYVTGLRPNTRLALSAYGMVAACFIFVAGVLTAYGDPQAFSIARALRQPL